MSCFVFSKESGDKPVLSTGNRRLYVITSSLCLIMVWLQHACTVDTVKICYVMSAIIAFVCVLIVDEAWRTVQARIDRIHDLARLSTS